MHCPSPSTSADLSALWHQSLTTRRVKILCLRFLGSPTRRCSAPCAWYEVHVPNSPSCSPFSKTQGVLYEPMALGCGHHFCGPCLLRMAGLQHHLGPFWLSWGCAPQGLTCPQCRAPVTETPVELPNLSQLCRQRCPAEWRARDEEEARWIQSLRDAWEAGNPQRLPIVHHVGFSQDDCCC